MLPNDWLKKCLAQRQLAASDGRALSAYALSDAEFAELQTALQLSALFGVQRLLQLVGWNAAFVLYAAEWWRRCYDGQWSWEILFNSFHGSAQTLSVEQQQTIVDAGLHYWQRPLLVIDGQPRYLGTLACEGGLSLKQLQANSKWLSVMLGSTLKSLAAAAALKNARLRQLALRHRLKQLSRQFADDDWNTLRVLQAQPIQGQPLWQLAAQEPRVIVALVLQLDLDFMQHFFEELPVCCELVPLQAWCVVFARYQQYLAKRQTPSDVQMQLRQQIAKLPRLSGALQAVAEVLEAQLLRSKHSKLSLTALKKQLHHTAHPAADALPAELLAQCQNLPNALQSLIAPNPPATLLLPMLLAVFCLNPAPKTTQASLFQQHSKQQKILNTDTFNRIFASTLRYLSQQPDAIPQRQQEIARMINDDENDLIPEIQELINQVEHELSNTLAEAEQAKSDIFALQNSHEQLRQLRLEHEALKQEHEELKENFNTLQSKYTRFIDNLKHALKIRDDTIYKLLQDVQTLQRTMQEIREQLLRLR